MKKALILCVLAACANEDNLGNTIGTADWALALGGRGYETGDAVAIDSQGAVVIAGTGDLSQIDFGQGPIGNGNEWAFLAKRSADDGGPIWTVPLTGFEANATVGIAAIAIGKDDSIYVTGSYSGTVRFGGQTLVTPVAVSGDLFVAKYAGDGTLVWLRSLGPASNAGSRALALDANDTMFIAGEYIGTFEFLGDVHAANANMATSFFLSYSSDGDQRAARFLDAGPYIQGLALSPTGDVVLVGDFNASVSFGGGVIDPEAYSRGFVARYHADGSYVWARGLGLTYPDGQSTVLSAAIASDDRIAISGSQQTTGSFDNATTIDVLDGTGTEQWSSQIALDEDYSPPNPIALLDGTFAIPLWIDGPYNADHPDTVVGHLEFSAFDHDGSRSVIDIGNRLIAGARPTTVRCSTIGAHGEIALVGALGGEITIGPGSIATHGTDDSDALVVLLPPPN